MAYWKNLRSTGRKLLRTRPKRANLEKMKKKYRTGLEVNSISRGRRGRRSCRSESNGEILSVISYCHTIQQQSAVHLEVR